MAISPNPVGRPKIEFGEHEWDQIAKLCAMHCTGEEIAGVMGCSLDTLETRIRETYDLKFSEFFRQKASNGKMSLRKKQYQIAMEGNVSMNIWLGKNWLNQKDKLEHSGDESAPFTLNYKLDSGNEPTDN